MSDSAVANADLERQLADTRSELLTSENRFRFVYDHTPSMFFTVDRRGTVLSANRYALEHLGYLEEALIGKSVLQVVHPEDHGDVSCHLDACFADPGRARTISFRKVTREGATIWVREVVRVAGDGNERVALVVCEDVTEARAHQEAARQAEIKVHDKDEFMAMLGHELRNPLSPIVTALEILRAGEGTDTEVEVIGRQVAHLRRLVDDLLDISRISRGHLELEKERVEVAVVAALAVEIAEPLLQRKGQMLRVEIAPVGLPVHADPSRLAQAFANLLSNAAKFSDEGQEVVFSARRLGEQVIVTVRDHGEGIDCGMLERVFEPFAQRAQPADRAQSGLGLGLTIVRNLVELHGGSVHAESEGHGKGTRLVVRLPAAPGYAPALSPTEDGEVGHSASRVEQARDILVVDDNDDARTSLCRLLTLHGYRTASAPDGPSALRLAEQVHPRVVLVDIGLPGMDGYELARQLRRSHPSGLKLLAVTGYGQPTDRANSQAAGFNAHIVKPVEFSTLRRFLEAPV